MKLKKLVMTAIIFCGVALAGCNNGSTEKVLPETGGNDSSLQDTGEVQISYELNKKERQIWYLVSNSHMVSKSEPVGKDSLFCIFVFENGKFASSTWSNHLTGNKGDSISEEIRFGDIVKMTDEEVYKELVPVFLADSSFETFSLNLRTDSTGNRTETEVLSRETKGSEIFVSGYATIQVYDEFFTGLETDTGSYFVKRTNGDSYVLDQPGTKGVTVDE